MKKYTLEKFLKKYEGQSDFDDECMYEVEKLSEFSDISDCVKYFTESKYSLYVYEKDKPYYELEELN